EVGYLRAHHPHARRWILGGGTLEPHPKRVTRERASAAVERVGIDTPQRVGLAVDRGPSGGAVVSRPGAHGVPATGFAWLGGGLGFDAHLAVGRGLGIPRGDQAGEG